MREKKKKQILVLVVNKVKARLLFLQLEDAACSHQSLSNQTQNEEIKSYQPANIGNNGKANKTIIATIKWKKLLGSEKSSSCDMIKTSNYFGKRNYT